MPDWSFVELSLNRLLWVFRYFYLIWVKACTYMSKVLKMKFCRLFPDVKDQRYPNSDYTYFEVQRQAGSQCHGLVAILPPQTVGFILMLVPFMVNSCLSTVAIENICAFLLIAGRREGETPPQTWITTLSFSLMACWNHESTAVPVTVTEEFHAQINLKSILGVGLGITLVRWATSVFKRTCCLEGPVATFLYSPFHLLQGHAPLGHTKTMNPV